MECRKINVAVIYCYSKYIKIINHGKITYPPNIFILFHILHQPYYNIIISGPFFLEIQIRRSQNLYRRVVQTRDLKNVFLLNIFTKLNIIISDVDYLYMIITRSSLINTKTFRCMFYMMHYDSLVLCLCCVILNVVWRHHVCILRFHVYRHESYFPLLTDRIEVLYNQENSQPFKRLTGTRVRVALVTSSDIACPLKWHHISHGFPFWNYRLCLCKKPTKLSYFCLNLQ